MDRVATRQLIDAIAKSTFNILRSYEWYDKQLDDSLQEYFLYCYDSYEKPNMDDVEKVVSKWLLEKEKEL